MDVKVGNLYISSKENKTLFELIDLQEWISKELKGAYKHGGEGGIGKLASFVMDWNLGREWNVKNRK